MYLEKYKGGIIIENILQKMLSYTQSNRLLTIVMTVMMFDVFTGILRSIKEKNTNSTIGIDGMIRKIGMIGGMAFLIFIDWILQFNLISWMPSALFEVFSYIGMDKIGFSGLFGILFIAFEVLSIIKNWTMLGLPMFSKVTSIVKEFLKEHTSEMEE